MNIILHITQRDRWEIAKNIGTYRSDSLDTEGFIHCSTFSQLIGSANRFFKHQKDLVILVIDRDRVRSVIRDEGKEENNLFPHIHGELNPDAVVQVIDWESGTDGLFSLPPELHDV